MPRSFAKLRMTTFCSFFSNLLELHPDLFPMIMIGCGVSNFFEEF